MKKNKIQTLKQDKSIAAHSPTMAPKIVEKTISRVRRDVSDWKWAWQFATQATDPKQYMLQDLYDDVTIDALLTSQLNNRKERTISAPWELATEDEKVDDNLTKNLAKSIPFMTDLFSHMIDSEWYGCSLVEMSVENGIKKITLIKRRNVVPANGRFYPDTSMNNFISYREAGEYGKWILEFDSQHIGLLNKLVPHVLFKKFAKSCWSELCEIFGIPPRVLKTETRDPAMLNRAEAMMREVGSAAWFIIDGSETLEWGKGSTSDGSVYNGLIGDCNNEMCMLVTGAILGQDTKNGNESKEKVSMSILDRLVEADKRMVENYMNTVVIPAWVGIGWMPPTTSRFRFKAVEDTDKLWQYTKEILPHKNVDNTFIEEKFGIKVTDKIETTNPNPAFK